MENETTNFNWLDILGPFTPFAVLAVVVFIVGAFAYYFWDPIRWAARQAEEAWKIFWHIQIWVYPAIMIMLGYLMPGLRVPASFFVPVEARGELIILGVVGILLLIIQFATADSQKADLEELINDPFLAQMWTIVLLPTCGWLLRGDELELWLAVPMLFVLIDLVYNNRVTIRNAWQRTEVQQ